MFPQRRVKLKKPTMEHYFLSYVLGPEKIYDAMIKAMLGGVLFHVRDKKLLQGIFNAFRVHTEEKETPYSLLIQGEGESN